MVIMQAAVFSTPVAKFLRQNHYINSEAVDNRTCLPQIDMMMINASSLGLKAVRDINMVIKVRMCLLTAGCCHH